MELISIFAGYIDPAATSVLLSSITAIIVAISATAIILWRKLKKKVSETLHIDPNAGKEVEEDIVIIDDEIKAETETLAETVAEEAKEEVSAEETKEDKKDTETNE